MTTEQNKEIVRRYRSIHNSNQLDQLDDIVAETIVSHNLLPGVPPGLQTAKMVHNGALASFPDSVVKTEDLFAEGDKVVERWSQTATYNGASFLGAPVTGKSFTVGGISIYRIENGKIAEHWAQMDTMSVMQQLGLAPAPAHA
jgi:predicted ester cyclase